MIRAKMLLTDIEAKVLGVIQLNPFQSAHEVAAETGLNIRSTHGALQRLRRRKILGSPKVAIDRSALGVTEFQFLYALTRVMSKEKGMLLHYLEKNPRVKFAGETGGRWQLSLTMSSHTTNDALSFIHDFAGKFGKHLHAQEIAVRASFSLFPRKYLLGRSRRIESIEYGAAVARVSLDEIDRNILETMSSPGWDSFRSVAERIKVAPGTVLRRVEALRKGGVIAGFYLPVDPSTFGRQLFTLLVYCSAPNLKTTKRLHSWGAAHLCVTGFAVTIGAWAFEIMIEVVSPVEANGVAQEMLDSFAEEVSRIEVLPFFRYLKSGRFDRLLGI
jgi:DNA-binding Lrp family transcriptional regulator